MPGTGAFRDLVTFQTEVQTPDEGGGYSVMWANDLIVHGQFLPERSRERLDAGRLAVPLAGVLRVRSSSETRALTEGARVLIDAEAYNILSIANEDRHDRFLTMTVEKGVAV